MKKMILALVAMFVMSTSVFSQDKVDSVDAQLSFERMSSFLELTSDQREPVATSLTQLGAAMQSFYQLKDASKSAEAWEKIENRHMKQMKQVLTQKQYDKYVKIFEQTIRNKGNNTQP